MRRIRIHFYQSSGGVKKPKTKNSGLISWRQFCLPRLGKYRLYWKYLFIAKLLKPFIELQTFTKYVYRGVVLHICQVTSMANNSSSEDIYMGFTKNIFDNILALYSTLLFSL